MEREALRQTFNSVAADYDRVRPKYPEAVFDDLVALAGLGPGSRVVEVGCGTGQATVPLAQRGLAIVAVELGPDLAATCRRNVAAFSDAEVVNEPFEAWEPPDGPGFDAVISFAAFHWVDPDVRVEKSGRLLRQGGTLAVFDWHDVLPPDGDRFFVDVLEDYSVVAPEWSTPMPAPDLVESRLSASIAEGFSFDDVQTKGYLFEQTYSASDYVTFLNTRSRYRLLDADRRQRLFERIERRIERRPGGTVTKSFLGMLDVAQRL